jgi:hypothetical protein
MTIVPDYRFDDAPQPRLIVVPAMEEPSTAMLTWIRQASRGTDLTLSVCNGVFVLAKAGLLSGKEATSHHGAYALLQADFPDIKVKRGARFVDGRAVSTAGGLTSGIDLVLHVVERYFGDGLPSKPPPPSNIRGKAGKIPTPMSLSQGSPSQPMRIPSAPCARWKWTSRPRFPRSTAVARLLLLGGAQAAFRPDAGAFHATLI